MKKKKAKQNSIIKRGVEQMVLKYLNPCTSIFPIWLFSGFLVSLCAFSLPLEDLFVCQSLCNINEVLFFLCFVVYSVLTVNWNCLF